MLNINFLNLLKKKKLFESLKFLHKIKSEYSFIKLRSGITVV